MNKMAKKKNRRLLMTGLAGTLVLALGLTATSSLTSALAGTLGGKYYGSYSSIDDALDAAGDLNLQVAEEGNVLLKNDGTLPLTGSEYVSVFGVSSSQLVGASGNTNSVGNADGVSERGPIYDSLVEAGFNVNTVLADYYAEGNGANDIGSETTSFSGSLASSISLYNDVGIIVISRNAGEGADADMVTGEVENETYLGEETDWEHANLYQGTYDSSSVQGTSQAYDKTLNKYKHYLELTDSEQELIKYVESKCDKVVVVLNTANAMEMYNLREDDQINGILLMGRPGETGHYSVGEILKGTVNPSGKLVDEWNTDFTADPTWSNFGYNQQNGSENIYYYKNSDGDLVTVNGNSYGTHQQNEYYGTDYEEDIYLGYAYWETYYYEYYQSLISKGTDETEALETVNAWYDKSVTFQFGYGLSYSTFSFNIDEEKIYATGNNGKVSSFDLSDSSSLATLFASSEGNPAEAKTLYIPVTVTNTSSVAGKEVVQIYVTAPYGDDACLEKSYVTLAGYAKTDTINPGQSQTVYVEVNVQDFSSFDYNDANENGNKGYELEAGEYIIRAMDSSHYDLATDVDDTTDAYDEVRFTLNSTVKLQLDDYSDNTATALFSDDLSNYQFTTDNTSDDYKSIKYNSLRTADYMEDGKSAEVLLSRSNILTYFPQAPTEGDLTFKKSVIDNWEYWNDFDTDDTENDEWYVATEDIPSNWTQGTGTVGETGTYATTLDMMMGVELLDSSTESGYSEAWDNFMNQLSLDELKYLVERQNSMWTTSELATIGKISTTQADSYNDVRTAGGSFLWTDSPTLSATWNTDLANKVGIMRGNIEVLNGWSGYGGKEMDTHRSPFSGRNAEYLSQDGIQGGYMAAAFTSGMESMGVTCYIKHFALNDSETCRDGMCNRVWVSEQAARQIYFKVFQMAMQEGGASAAMTGFASFCGVPVSRNYRMLNTMVQGEWGWTGFYITDGYSGVSGCTTMETMLRCSVIPLPLGSSVPSIQGEWDETLRDGKGDITIDGEENSTQYYYLRTTAMKILYADAKSNDVLNGFVLTSLSAQSLSVTQGSEISASLGLTASQLGDSTAVYTISGTLPDGVTFSSDGTLSGTPTEAGTYTFTIDATIDGWVTSSLNSGLSATYTLTVNSAFYLEDANNEAITSLDLQAGDTFAAYILSDSIDTSDGGTITYSITSGSLPEGLTLNESTGTITGSVSSTAVNGDYEVVINVAKASASSGGGGWGGGWGGFPGGGSSTTTTNYSYTLTFTVTGGVDADASGSVEEAVYLTESEVQDLIDAAIAKLDLSGDGLTESEVNALISAAIADIDTDGLTESEVQALIDAAIADISTDSADSTDSAETTDSGCSGSIAANVFTVVGMLAAAAVVCTTVTVARKKRDGESNK